MSNHHSYLLKISYNGYGFCGFQSQPDGRAIQDEIEKSCRVFFREDVRVLGASRTDSGVHAEGQRARIQTTKPFDRTRWLRGLNALLPVTIRIRSIDLIDDSLDPIRSAQAKVYRYRLWQGHCDHPMIAPFVWSVYPTIQVDLLAQQAQFLVGSHDFSSFRNQGSTVSTTQRTIYEIVVESRGPLVNIWVIGGGFLKQMVRILVGTLVDINAGRLARDSLPVILAAKNRDRAGITAPAQGLTLVDISYQGIPTVAEIVAQADSGYTLSV